jgi:hypothetical protein
MRNLAIVSAGTSQPSTTRMLADRIAAASLDRLREMEVTTTVGSIEVAPLAVDVARASVTAVVIDARIEQGIADRAWSGYQHEFAGNATRAEQTAADVDFDSPLMRLAAGGRTN